jgi:hypothetical protein
MNNYIKATLYVSGINKQKKNRQIPSDALDYIIKSYTFETVMQSEVEAAMSDLGYDNKDYWLS